MKLHVTLEGNTIKNLDTLQVSDKVLCDDGIFRSVKSIVVISSYPTFIRLSNGTSYYIPERVRLKTSKGFKAPELWDVLEYNSDLTPQVINIRKIDRVMFFRDILIDGNMVAVEGLVFKYSD